MSPHLTQLYGSSKIPFWPASGSGLDQAGQKGIIGQSYRYVKWGLISKLLMSPFSWRPQNSLAFFFTTQTKPFEHCGTQQHQVSTLGQAKHIGLVHCTLGHKIKGGGCVIFENFENLRNIYLQQLVLMVISCSQSKKSYFGHTFPHTQMIQALPSYSQYYTIYLSVRKCARGFGIF